MLESLYIQNYYYYTIGLLVLLTLLTMFSYFGQSGASKRLINIVLVLFSVFTVFYLGTRDLSIGTDTFRYEKAFNFYKTSSDFEIRKDVFYDFLSFSFAKIFSFKELLIFCATLYVFGAFYGLKRIFGANVYLPFIVFIISPYFFTSGINVMRSGVAASLFLVGLGVYYDIRKWPKPALWFFISVLFHISMLLPVLFFAIARYVKSTKIIFLIWLMSIGVGVLNINIVHVVVDSLGLFEDRVGDYTINEGQRNFWMNFAIFGAIPVLFSVYNVLYLKYKDDFYTWLLNGYMLIHVPYIMLLNSQYALRLGYLAEFMMPIILMYPLLINSKLNITYDRLKLCFILFFVFMVKAYKILVI